MATQMDPSPQKRSPKTNSHSQVVQNTQPDIDSTSHITVPRQDVDSLTDEQRRELIAVTAYYLAERRNFEPGHEDEDWRAAESQVGSLGTVVS